MQLLNGTAEKTKPLRIRTVAGHGRLGAGFVKTKKLEGVKLHMNDLSWKIVNLMESLKIMEHYCFPDKALGPQGC